MRNEIFKFPCNLEEVIGVLFSYNERVMIWYNDQDPYDDPKNPNNRKLLWKGIARNIILDTDIKYFKFVKIIGIKPENIDDADVINILVDPHTQLFRRER